MGDRSDDRRSSRGVADEAPESGDTAIVAVSAEDIAKGVINYRSAEADRRSRPASRLPSARDLSRRRDRDIDDRERSRRRRSVPAKASLPREAPRSDRRSDFRLSPRQEDRRNRTPPRRRERSRSSRRSIGRGRRRSPSTEIKDISKDRRRADSPKAGDLKPSLRSTRPRLCDIRFKGRDRDDIIDHVSSQLCLSLPDDYITPEESFDVADIFARLELTSLHHLSYINDEDLSTIFKPADRLQIKLLVRGIISKVKSENMEQRSDGTSKLPSVDNRETLLAIRDTISSFPGMNQKKKSDGINRKDMSDDEAPVFDLASALRLHKISRLGVDWFGDIRKLSKFHKFLEKNEIIWQEVSLLCRHIISRRVDPALGGGGRISRGSARSNQDLGD